MPASVSMSARPTTAPATIAVLDPATGERIAAIPAGDEIAVDAAVRAARAASRSGRAGAPPNGPSC